MTHVAPNIREIKFQIRTRGMPPAPSKALVAGTLGGAEELLVKTTQLWQGHPSGSGNWWAVRGEVPNKAISEFQVCAQG